MTRRTRLIEALKAERTRFCDIGRDTTDHDYAIEYLSSGRIPHADPDTLAILDAAINDYETLCRDYGVGEE